MNSSDDSSEDLCPGDEEGNNTGRKDSLVVR